MNVCLIYPALYQMQNGPVRVWFRLDELFRAVKHEFRMHRWPTITSEMDLLMDYWLLNSASCFFWSDGESLFQAEDPTDITRKFDTFVPRGRKTIFVPAGWGEAVLTAVERGAREIVRLSADCTPSGQGVRREDEAVIVSDLVWCPGKRRKMTRCV